MKRMTVFGAMVCLVLVSTGCATAPKISASPSESHTQPAEGKWLGVCIFTPTRDGLPALKRAIAGPFVELGVNALVIEVNYHFAYQSHPELVATDKAITKEDARELSQLCKANGIRIIPLFNCLGHQSWGTGSATLPLLVKYPEFDETPYVPKDNKGIYCRSWCPLHPDVNKIVFELMDELIAAFEPDAFHVGMDEVFLIADPKCPRCQGKDPAELYAKAVNDMYGHLVTERKLTMFMWGDRFLDQKATWYNLFESSRNGTPPAIDMVPKDIVICDWHYGKRPSYPSVDIFQAKGFRVWPSSWDKPEAALAFLNYARKNDQGKVVGHLCTTWCDAALLSEVLLGEADTTKVSPQVLGIAQALRDCSKAFRKRR